MRVEIERWVRQAREDQASALRARLGSYDRMRWASLARGDQALVARYDALIQDAERALGWGAPPPDGLRHPFPGPTLRNTAAEMDNQYSRLSPRA
jgi:hypothetical protein